MRLIGSGPWTLMAPKSVAPLKPTLTAVSAVALFCCKNCLALKSFVSPIERAKVKTTT